MATFLPLNHIFELPKKLWGEETTIQRLEFNPAFPGYFFDMIRVWTYLVVLIVEGFLFTDYINIFMQHIKYLNDKFLSVLLV